VMPILTQGIAEIYSWCDHWLPNGSTVDKKEEQDKDQYLSGLRQKC
jgi:hypothetical protein